MRVTAAVIEEKSGVFTLDTLDLDAPRPEEVLVKLIATGIRHTDLHARDGYFQMPYPAVYGSRGGGCRHCGRQRGRASGRGRSCRDVIPVVRRVRALS